jgi:hypothetical protein
MEGCVSPQNTVQPLAYRVGDERLPWKRLTLYRWEKKGLIPPLLRVGGKTMIRADTVEAILNGKIAIPPHVSRTHRPKPPKRKPKKAREGAERT